MATYLNKAFIITLFIALLAVPEIAMSREMAAQRECATCHIMWLDSFRIKDMVTLMDSVPMDKIVAAGAADEVMCHSCHDGFVLDSRNKVWDKIRHPVGVKPSDKIHLPRREDGTVIFPLDKKGEVYCGTCHSAHGRAWEEGREESPIFMRGSNKDSALCKMCHSERATGPKGGNHPIDKTTIDVPASLLAVGAKVGSKPNQVICQSCHIVHGAGGEKILAIDNTNSALCGTCHSDRYAKDRVEAADMATHPVNITSDRVNVPQEILKMGGKLGKNGEIICQSCHMPHYAARDTKILVEENVKSSLCKRCHTDKLSVDVTKHNLEQFSPEEANINGVKAGMGGSCSACHLPHKGKGPKMWARTPYEKGDNIARLCLSCHSDGKVAEKKQTGTYTHPTMVSIKGADGKTTLPLFDQNGIFLNTSTEGNITCGTCHNVHQWDPKDPRIGAGKGVEGDARNSFLRKPSDAKATLCMECHSDKNIIGSDHDLQVTAKREKNVLGQTPVESGPCGSCHLPHNGRQARMWAKDVFGKEDPISLLCKSCHSEGKAASAKQVGRYTHPVGALISNIGIKPIDKDTWVEGSRVRFGSATSWLYIKALPLFDEEGHRNSNGSVTCATCHNPHQWDPKAVKEGPGTNTEGDGSNSFLRKANNPDSALCKNCHYQRSVVFSKHNLQISAPDEKNVSGNKVAETGPCSACHIPHNGYSLKMWARKLSGEEDFVSQLCKSCHSKGKVADKKTVGEFTHPVNIAISRVGGESTLPLLFDSGVKGMKDGKVVCATCHNVHQWDANDPNSTAGARKDVEGDVTNSFLRISPSPDSDLCADCHRDKRFVKRTKHDLNISAPNALNLLGQPVSKSGPCGACHSVHNAQQRVRLWGRKMGQGDDIPEMRCRSCHATGEMADKKMPQNFKHPKDVIASNVGRGRGGDFPLYNKEGERKNSGVITCPTCHDPHIWSAAKADFGPGKMTEGNINDSFLRNLSPSILCADCHGLDSIFRYKYFHAGTSRKKYPLYGTGD